MKCGKKSSFLVFAWLFLGAVVPVVAHEYHVSYAEVEWNREHERFETALRLLPEDLEQALEVAEPEKGRVDLQLTPEIDVRIVGYLENHFRVLDSAGKLLPIRWVGKEVDYRAVWIYFEVEVEIEVEGPGEEGEPPSWKLENTVLREINSQQVNTVVYRADGKRRTWTMTDSSGAAELRIGDF